MDDRILTNGRIQEFSAFLLREEKSGATWEKYLRDVRRFLAFAGSTPVSKEMVVRWKKHLVDRGYAVRSICCTPSSVHRPGIFRCRSRWSC